MLDRDFLTTAKEIDELPTYAYTAFKDNRLDEKPKAQTPMLISTTMTGSDFQKSKLEGYRIIGSCKASDADTGEVLLMLGVVTVRSTAPALEMAAKE